MGNSSTNNRNFHQMLFGVIYSLGNGVSYFIGFAKTVTHHAVSVTYDDDSCKGETTSALYHFRHALDGYDLFLKINFACLDCADVALCHPVRILIRLLW